MFVSIYFNAMNDRRSFNLIARERRIFGYDQVKTWHRYPFEAPDEHVPCDEPSLTRIFDEIASVAVMLAE